MTPTEEALVEQVTSAHRERARDGAIRWSPAFFDLDADGRREAFQATLRLREMERALDPAGHSSTVRALLARLVRTP